MIQYAEAIKTDFLAVAALDRCAWTQYGNAENIPDGEHVWRIWAEHALMFVAKQDLALIGAIVAFPCISGTWYVHKLMVSPDKRKQGIGTGLLNRLLGAIDGLGASSFLTVDPQNQKLIAFYKTLGFTDSVLAKGYYRDSEDRCVLTRKRGLGVPTSEKEKVQ